MLLSNEKTKFRGQGQTTKDDEGRTDRFFSENIILDSFCNNKVSYTNCGKVWLVLTNLCHTFSHKYVNVMFYLQWKVWFFHQKKKFLVPKITNFVMKRNQIHTSNLYRFALQIKANTICSTFATWSVKTLKLWSD